MCLVDAFRNGSKFFVIDPDECIDRAVGVPEYPVNAIYAKEDVAALQRHFTPLNAKPSREWKSIKKTKPPLREAKAWSKSKNNS